jgi:hypothetical protein
VHSIERRWDPLTRSIVYSGCIDIDQWSYLQGGSGFLLSRFAAGKIASFRN